MNAVMFLLRVYSAFLFTTLCLCSVEADLRPYAVFQNQNLGKKCFKMNDFDCWRLLASMLIWGVL